MKSFIALLKQRFFAFTLSFVALFSSSLIVQGQGATASNNLVSQYNLSIKILPENHRLEVTGTWQLPPRASETNEIQFYLSPKMEKPEVQVLEPKISISPASLSGVEESGDMKWTLKLDQTIPVGQSILLRFSYNSDDKVAPQFNISPEGSFAGGGGELWYPQSSFKEKDIGTLRFIVPAGETAISNGVSVSNDAQKARGEFTFRNDKPVKFGFAAGKYQVFRRAGKIPLTLYLLKPREHAQKLADDCSKALNFLTGLFGDFPYQEFSLVEVDFRSRVGGTAEFGFILGNKTEFDVYDLSYWAHEIGHQWWGNVVRSKSGEFGQMMFSEGIAQFGSLLAVEAIEGEKAAEDFRRNSYRNFRRFQSAAGYFELVSSGRDFPLTLYKPKDQNEILLMHRLANSKGFILMDMLSRRIGREKFTTILKRFIKQKVGQLTSWKEFQATVEAEAGQDIHWFFEQWFERTGAPDYHLTWKQKGNTVHGEITQPAPFFRAKLEVIIKGVNNRKLLKTIEIIDGEIKFNWVVSFKVDSVTLDPDYKVLRWLPEFRKQ